ncbi:trypco2 family protein [Streptomyces yanii]|uniref:Trypco2 family protein n=1 Tax=Streptomyces yanii TaxID=78510 RepID=A0ABV5RM59_9ACTN
MQPDYAVTPDAQLPGTATTSNSTDARATDGIELADAVESIRNQLIDAASRADDRPVALELRKEVKGGGKVKAWVVETGADASRATGRTRKVSLTLETARHHERRAPADRSRGCGQHGALRSRYSEAVSATRPTARTVAFHGSGAVQSSGALLTDRLVLTCAHVVKGGNRAVVAHPDLPSTFPAWESLLLAPGRHGEGAAPEPYETVRGSPFGCSGAQRALTRPSSGSGRRRLPPARSAGRRAAPTSPRRGR